MRTIWLFDLDGVLIHPGGYRAALKATVNHLSREMGLGDGAPDEETIHVFEACGLSSEWDSAPLCAAVLLLEAVRGAPGFAFPPDFWGAASAVRAVARPGTAEGVAGRYQALARRATETRRPGELPGAAVLRVLTEEWLPEAGLDGRGPALAGAWQHLLGDTRDFPRAPGIFVFQHYALGSAAFAETYEQPAQFETPGLLRAHDRPALSPDALARVRRLLAGELRAAVITARPSLPPSDEPAGRAGYSPEAELAVDLAGIADLPLIGFGRLQWLAREHERHAEELLKPSPVHALAAIGAALAPGEAAALRAAYRLAELGEADECWRGLAGERLRLHVFEDSPSGVRAVFEAAERLRRIGVAAKVNAWGVAAHPVKAQALREAGARVLPSANEAIAAAAAAGGL